ncbi:retrotransposon protein, putative, ty1-copia subclass [Tanacetum coccineum]
MATNQTTNNNSIRSILEKEKLNGSNFLDWYRNLRIVLRNEQKLHHLEEALPEAPPATATATIQKNLEDRPVFEILQELKTMFQQQAKQELSETIKAFYACKQEEGQFVSTYVLKMKAYLDQMEHLGYPMPLVLGKPKSQARGKGKQRGKGKSKLAYDPKHKIPPPAKKEHPAKDTECHYRHKTRHWKRNYPLYLAELKKNKASASGTSCIFTIELFLFPKSNSWIYDTGCGTHICNTIQGLRGYRKLNKGALDLYVGNGNTTAVEAIGSFDLILPSGMILVLDDSEFFETNLIKQEASGSTVDFDEIQSEDAQPSENTSLHQHEVEHDTIEPQTDVIPIRRSTRIPQALERYSFYIDAEEHKLEDHGKPPNYQAALSDPEFEKWLKAINVEMQSMKDNQVWNLVDLPPKCKTVGSKGIFKKKTDMDGNIHTYKACLVAKGFTQTYGVDYEETFSPVADIKSIMILIAIAAYYDYEIWQMDVKTVFLNGRLNKDVYMVQPKGFVNPKHHGRVCKLQRSIYGLKQASRS